MIEDSEKEGQDGRVMRIDSVGKRGKEERAHATGEGSARHLQGGGLGSGIPGGFRKTQEASPLMLLASLLLLEGLLRRHYHPTGHE